MSSSKSEAVDSLSSCCIICQTKLKSETVAATEKGIKGLIRSTAARKDKNDEFFKEAIVRINSALNEEGSAQTVVFYHRDCYATFTSSSHISRLREKPAGNSKHCLNVNKISQTDIHLGSDSQNEPDCTKCIFCQSVTPERIRKVQTEKMEIKIKSLVSVNAELNARILGGSKCGIVYHSNCLNKYQRLFDKLSTRNDDSQKVALPNLISELRVAATEGKVCL